MRSGQLFPTCGRSLAFLAFIAVYAAGCGGSTAVTELVGPSDSRCQLSLTAEASGIPADGREITVEIAAARDCNWEARSEADWVQLSTTTGQGPASVAVKVASNPRGTSRSTAVVVNNQRLAFSQEARPCRFTLNPSAADVGADEGRVTAQVETIDGCAWRASTTASWIRVGGEERTGSGSLTITVVENGNDDTRRGVVTVGDQSLTIGQSGRAGTSAAPGPSAPVTCTPSVQPGTLDVPANAQSHSVDLEIGAGCSWTAASNDPWISLTSPASGSGEARIQFTTAANTGTAARTGSLTVAAQRVTIRQLVASQAQPCTYTLDPPSRSLPVGGGDGTVTVTTRSDCPWSVSEDAGWIAVATDSGQGNATVRYTVQPNGGTSSRSANIRIAGRSHRVSQAAAAPACTYSLEPTSQTVAATGGEAQFRVVTQNGCAWSASDNAAWTTITRGSGTGTGEVVFTVQANSAQQTRMTAITAGGQTHTLTQSAATAPACTYSLDPTSQTVSASGGEARFRVVTQTDCAWTAAGGAAWTSITTGSGNGTGEVVLTVQPNNAQQTRAATITAGGQSHSLTQAAAAAPACTYTLEPASQTVAASGGEARFRVATQSGCAWTASGGAAWATITSGTGSGPGEVVFTVQANSAQQSRAMSISAGGQSHAVTQAAAAAPTCTYALDPGSQTLAASGGEARFRVVTQAGCAWTAAGGADWTSITAGSGSGTGDVVFTVQANTAAQTRAATITAGGQSHAVTQAAAAAPTCTYALDPGSQTVAASGGEARFRVVTQAGCAWTAAGGAAWTSITTGSGSGTGDVVFTVQANTAAQTRAATITAGGQSHAVTQAAAAPTCTYALEPTSQNVGASGGEARFRVATQSGCAWTASGGAAWTSITSGTGSGTGDVVFTVQANTAPQTRAATITAGGQSHSVTQAAAAPTCTYALDPTSQNVGASGGEARFRVVTQAGCTWSASGGAAWTSITSGPGSGTGDVVFTVQANTATQTRAATISAGGQSHTVTQAAAAPACTYSLDPAAQTVPAAGGEARIRVVTQTGCTWTASGGAAWASITSGAGSGSGEIVVTVQANTAQQTRATSISAGAQSHALTQAAAAAPPTGP